MEMSHSQLLNVPQLTVWAALNDPDILKECIPGCESFAPAGEHEYAVAIRTAVGPVKARFTGRVKLSDIRPAEGYTLTFEGQGGPAGFAKGEAAVNLAPENGATRLSYRVKAHVGGKLAQVGSRLIDGAAKKLADEFFTAFAARLEPQAEAMPAQSQAMPAGRVWMPAWGWAVLLLLVVVFAFFLM